MKKARKLLTLTALSSLMAPNLLAQSNKLEAWGNAAGTTPAPSLTSNGTSTAIFAGGADFWGNSDAGAFAWNDSGAYTTTGDFTAVARHVSTTEPAPSWGRDGIMVRATQGGNLNANDAHWMAMRTSDGLFGTGRRPTAGAGTFRATNIDNAGVNYNSDDNDRRIGTGNVTNTPLFMAAARQGNTLYSGYAADLGGTPGRWVTHWSTDNATAISGLQGGAQVTVGLAHQSHPQSGAGPSNAGLNTATYDNWAYTGSFDASKFGLAAGAGANPWSVGGSLNVSAATGVVRGSAFTRQGGVATGEATKWTFNATPHNPIFGVAGARKNAVAMETADIVPASNFRINSTTPGLTANIYVNQANPGNEAGVRAIINNAANLSGTTVIPNVDWTGNGGTSPTNAAPYNQGEATGDFSLAVAGQFAGGVTANQENYGVHMVGQIFIPGDADRKGSFSDTVLFKDGIDDYTFLSVDGQVLLNDNDWTGYGGTENGGGHVAGLDVRDAKFDDGEWVAFEMISWEGGGGDAGVLYWDANDVNGTFSTTLLPSNSPALVSQTGFTQVGTEASDVVLGVNLPAGEWDVSLIVENTGTSATFIQGVTVVPEPTSAILVALTGLGVILRRRR